MSAQLRAQAQKLRAKYANHFKLPLEDVVVDFLEGMSREGDAEVYSPQRTDLPSWFVGGSS